MNMNTLEARQAKLKGLRARAQAVKDEAAQQAAFAATDPETPANLVAEFERISGGEAVAAKLPDYGFRHFGEFLGALRAQRGPGPKDPRMQAQAAATTFAGEDVGGPTGGWAAPPGIVEGIVEAVAGTGTLLGAMQARLTDTNQMFVAVDAGLPGGTTGLQAAETAEGAASTATAPALQQRIVTLYKATSMVNVSEELASDSPAAGDAIARILAREIRAVAERWLLRGSGLGEPVGILGAPALISVSGSGSGTLTTTHLGAAFGRFMAGAGSFLVAGPSATGAIRKIQMDGGTIPVPVVSSLELPAVGTVGDAILVNPAGFLTYTRGVQSQATIYFAFDQGLHSLRAHIRIGQVPVLSAAVTPTLDTGATVSHCVTTATRA